MRTVFYVTAACFGAIISPSSGSWHENLFKTYSNKVGHNKLTYVVVSVVQNFTVFKPSTCIIIEQKMCPNYTNECCVGAMAVSVELLWHTRNVGAGLILTYDRIYLLALYNMTWLVNLKGVRNFLQVAIRNNKVNVVSNHVRILTLCFVIALTKRHY